MSAICQESAAAVVPVIKELFAPETVIDVGGGEGWWGRAFYELGSSVVVADQSIDSWRFETSGAGHRLDFLPVDLTDERWARQLAHERAQIADIHGGLTNFDLAVCLEVADQLPAENADELVLGLCSIAPVVLFSAAIPGQGGHLNEQWPDYWRVRFHEHGFACTDWPRWRFWDDDRVEPCYRQNLMLFSDIDTLYSALFREDWRLDVRPVVHPDIFGWKSGRSL